MISLSLPPDLCNCAHLMSCALVYSVSHVRCKTCKTVKYNSMISWHWHWFIKGPEFQIHQIDKKQNFPMKPYCYPTTIYFCINRCLFEKYSWESERVRQRVRETEREREREKGGGKNMPVNVSVSLWAENQKPEHNLTGWQE